MEDYFDPSETAADGETPYVDMAFSRGRFAFSGVSTTMDQLEVYGGYRTEIKDYISESNQCSIFLEFKFSYIASSSFAQVREMCNDVLKRFPSAGQDGTSEDGDGPSNMVFLRIDWYQMAGVETVNEAGNRLMGLVEKVKADRHLGESIRPVITVLPWQGE